MQGDGALIRPLLPLNPSAFLEFRLFCSGFFVPSLTVLLPMHWKAVPIRYNQLETLVSLLTGGIPLLAARSRDVARANFHCSNFVITLGDEVGWGHFARRPLSVDERL